MEFYEAVNKRRTVRDFANEPVSKEVLERILSSGLKAPSNDHLREWHFVVLEDKNIIRKAIALVPGLAVGSTAEEHKKFMSEWQFDDDCQQKMYDDGVPKQNRMLIEAAYVILPLYRQEHELLAPQTLSGLNAFASIWCCIENILLAAAAEGLACSLRIPLGNEEKYIKGCLNIPQNYTVPCYLGLGKPAPNASLPKQKQKSLQKAIHYNKWP